MGAVTALVTESFRQQMKRLKGLKFAPTDLTTHWEALSDVPLDMLKAAIDRAQRECEDFPSPSTLRGFVDQESRRRPVEPDEDRSIALAKPVTFTAPEGLTIPPVARMWRYYCEDCSDSGWRSVWCGPRTEKRGKEEVQLAKPWMESGSCGRYGEHGPHEFAVPCPCASSNPAILKRKERHAQGARRTDG